VGLAAPYSLTGGTCASGATLSEGDSCTLEVKFEPSAAGAANATLSVSYNDGSSSQSATRAITGTGAAAPFSNAKSVRFTAGSSTYANCGHVNDLNFMKTSAFSLSAWVKLTNSPT